MRLTPREIAAIKTAATEAFGDSAVVRLFGSRVHDHLRGGDIDLHVETDPALDWSAARSLFVRTLHRRIGERSIDVLGLPRGSSPGPLDRAAVETGIIL